MFNWVVECCAPKAKQPQVHCSVNAGFFLEDGTSGLYSVTGATPSLAQSLPLLVRETGGAVATLMTYIDVNNQRIASADNGLRALNDALSSQMKAYDNAVMVRNDFVKKSAQLIQRQINFNDNVDVFNQYESVMPQAQREQYVNSLAAEEAELQALADSMGVELPITQEELLSMRSEKEAAALSIQNKIPQYQAAINYKMAELDYLTSLAMDFQDKSLQEANNEQVMMASIINDLKSIEEAAANATSDKKDFEIAPS